MHSSRVHVFPGEASWDKTREDPTLTWRKKQSVQREISLFIVRYFACMSRLLRSESSFCLNSRVTAFD